MDVNALWSWEHQHERYLLKPMNCPHHVQMYKAMPRSYRDLPVRLAEFGTVYRHEQSGELNGLLRVRGLTQDDAHLFCTPEQVETEFQVSLMEDMDLGVKVIAKNKCPHFCSATRPAGWEIFFAGNRLSC